MNYFYDAQQNTFYHKDIHQNIPEQAVAISDEAYQQLLEGQTQGQVVRPNKQGEPILVEPPASEFHHWNGEKWEAPTDEATQQAMLNAQKSAKLTEINMKAQAFVAKLARLEEVPEFERETWGIQREEAKAWFTDKTAETPTLAIIAQTRGVPLDLLRQKAYEKAVAYQTVAAIVAGQRQAFEDKLERAQSVEAVLAIEVNYRLTEGKDE